MNGQLMQIGEVAARTGLSLRTIRFYEQAGIAVPSARSTGGFRLYAEADVRRLHLAARMKPLDFSLDQMRELLSMTDRLAAGGLSTAEKATMAKRLEFYEQAAAMRCRSLRPQLAGAEEFAVTLAVQRENVARQTVRETVGRK